MPTDIAGRVTACPESEQNGGFVPLIGTDLNTNTGHAELFLALDFRGTSSIGSS